MAESLPKLLYRLTEVSDMLNIPASAIKYWGTVFPNFLVPARSKGGQRRYTPANIEMVKEINYLMRVKKMSIEGANKHLAATRKPFREIVCQSAQDAIEILTKTQELIADNPKASAMVLAVEQWLKKC